MMKKYSLSILFGALFVSGLLVAEPAQQEAESVAMNTKQKLMQLTQELDIDLVEDPDLMLLGIHPAALSKGKWSDAQVGAFIETFQKQPVVLPLSAAIPEELASSAEQAEGSEDAPPPVLDFNIIEEKDVYFLYIKPPKNQEKLIAIRDNLAMVLEEEYQQRLTDSQLLRLSEAQIQQWKVALRLETPKFSGGYD